MTTPAITRRRLLQAGGIGALSLATPGIVAARVGSGESAHGRGREVVHLHPAVRRAQPPRHLGPEARRARRRSAGRTSRSPPRSPACASASCTPRLAKLTKHFALIRSMTHVGNISNHFDAMHNCLSGQAGAPHDAPYIGSVLSKVRPSQRNIASLRLADQVRRRPGLLRPEHRHRRLPRRPVRPAVRRLGRQPPGHARLQGARRCSPPTRPPSACRAAAGCSTAWTAERPSDAHEQELAATCTRRGFELATAAGAARRRSSWTARPARSATATAATRSGRTCCWPAGWSRRASAS